MAFFQILSLLTTICNMYMYITCMFLKAIVYAKGRDWCRYRASGRNCGGARGHHLCLTDTILVKGIMLAAIYHIVRFRLLIIPYILAFYFISYSEFQCMSKADKSSIVYSEKIRIFSLVTNTIYIFFHCSKQRLFRQFSASFLPGKSLEGTVRV